MASRATALAVALALALWHRWHDSGFIAIALTSGQAGNNEVGDYNSLVQVVTAVSVQRVSDGASRSDPARRPPRRPEPSSRRPST